MESVTFFFMTLGFLAHAVGLSNALMDTSRDGKNTSWLFTKKWFNDSNVHYTLKEKQRIGIGILSIPNDFWHITKMINIIATWLSIFCGISLGIISMVDPVFDSMWLMVITVGLGGSLLWFIFRAIGFSLWYECLLWKDPIDGITNYLKKIGWYPKEEK